MPTNVYNSFSTANTTVTTTTETVIATVSAVTTGTSGSRVIVRGDAQVTVGTGATALTVRIRRGTAITDPLVGEANAQAVTGAAGSTELVSLTVQDDPGELVSGSYVLTVQQTAATGNATAVQGNISAEVGF